MYVSVSSLGADLVVSQADAARAQKEIEAIERANAAAREKYSKDHATYLRKVAERNAIIQANAAAAQVYAATLAKYQAYVRGVEAENAASAAIYDTKLRSWQTAYDKYKTSTIARAAAIAALNKTTADVLKKYGVSAPAGYTGCLSAADKARYIELCRQQSAEVTVRGLGAIPVAAGVPVCAYAELPECGNIPSLAPDPGAKPTRPTLKNIPGAPGTAAPRSVPAEPKPPVPPKMQQVPTLVVAPSRPEFSEPDLPPMTTAEEPKSYAVAGLLALVAVGGGAAYWYVKHKKKGKAA